MHQHSHIQEQAKKSIMIHRFESHKDPFKGLAIVQLEKDWTERLVLLFGLASGKHMEEDTLHSYLLYLLHENEKRWDIECQESAPNIR